MTVSFWGGGSQRIRALLLTNLYEYALYIQFSVVIFLLIQDFFVILHPEKN